MKNMTIKNIAHATDGQLFCSNENIEELEVKGVVLDNRLVEKGFVFVATVGERVDGHSFVNDAFQKGAIAAIVEKEDDYDGPYIKVNSSFDALRQLATFYRQQLSIPIVGIIGSVGKTSTKEMVASVLSQKYNVLKTKGNLNNDIGLPLTLLSIKEEHTAAVVEMGISDFGEMDVLAQIAMPDIVAFTNIGQCHLENLKTRDGILKAKTEVLKYLKAGAKVVVNLDDDKLSTISRKDVVDGVDIVSYGCNEEADYKVVDVDNLGLEGMSAKIKGAVNVDIRTSLPGEHNIANAACAVAVGHLLGENENELAQGVSLASTIDGRSNFIKKKGVTIIDDCYNANPVSMKASLNVLGLSEGNKIAILGDMGELGVDEVALHESVAEVVNKNGIDTLITIGPLAENIGKALGESDTSVHSYVGETAISDMLSEFLPTIKKGDTILIKASHFMNFPKIVKAISEYLD